MLVQFQLASFFAVAFTLVLQTPHVGATCANFAAWLKPVNQSHQAFGFVAFRPLPDGQSIVIDWQIQYPSNANPNIQTRLAGVFGPSTNPPYKPSNSGPLLDLGSIVSSPGNVVSSRIMRASNHMSQILSFMREGSLFVDVILDPTTKEELYGKIVIPSCMEASLQNTFASGFANLLYTAEYYALRFIFRQDVTGVTASLGFANVSQTSSVKLNNEIRTSGQSYIYTVGWKSDWPGVNFQSPATLTTSQGQILFQFAAALHCRVLSNVDSSLFRIAEDYRSDWITIWSMNPRNPDVRTSLSPIYFAHPYSVEMGGSAQDIFQRFGMSTVELQTMNQHIVDVNSLKPGGEFEQ
mmetsp:Transcript_38794/g.122281  ORF Transcript_38794/g.122281 Transcript_38794/m.122281 type:complete len:352 (-) Transcript_38794:243-1298(-)